MARLFRTQLSRVLLLCGGFIALGSVLSGWWAWWPGVLAWWGILVAIAVISLVVSFAVDWIEDGETA